MNIPSWIAVGAWSAWAAIVAASIAPQTETHTESQTESQTDGPLALPVELRALQRSYVDPEGRVGLAFSNHGVLEISTPPFDAESPLWFNAAVDGVWSIRNLSLLGDTPPDELATVWGRFPLPMPPGTTDGVIVGKLALEVWITPEPLPKFPPGGALFTLPVEQIDFFAGSDEGPREPAQPGPIVPQPATIVDRTATAPCETVSRPDVTGVSEGDRRCAPGAAARCLAWLGSRLSLDLPDDCTTAQQIYEKINPLMGTTGLGGTPDYGLPGIEAFLKKKGLADCLTFRMRRFSEPDPPTPDDLFDAMKRGYDVILLFGWWKRNADGALERTGGHQATATEVKRCGNLFQIKYRDDCGGNNTQGDGKPDRGHTKVTLQAASPDDREVPGSWWVPEEGADPETGVARTYRWEGFIQVCPTRLKLAMAIDAEALKLRQRVDAVGDPDAPTAQDLVDLVRQSRRLRDLVCCLRTGRFPASGSRLSPRTSHGQRGCLPHVTSP